MMSTRPPLPCTLSDLMSDSTGSAFSIGGVLPAAGAEAVRPADHDQAAALVVGVAADHFLLVLAEGILRLVVVRRSAGTLARITQSKLLNRTASLSLSLGKSSVR